MRRIKPDSTSPENTQGWHYKPKSAAAATQPFDPTRTTARQNRKMAPELRKLG
jgi:hypothetical protein